MVLGFVSDEEKAAKAAAEAEAAAAAQRKAAKEKAKEDARRGAERWATIKAQKFGVSDHAQKNALMKEKEGSLFQEGQMTGKAAAKHAASSGKALAPSPPRRLSPLRARVSDSSFQSMLSSRRQRYAIEIFNSMFLRGERPSGDGCRWEFGLGGGTGARGQGKGELGRVS
jgi:hypothetical protein